MADHAAREHSQWSASATERLWQCSGSLALTDGLPETTSEAADWGTACHQLAEKCLRGNGPADRHIGTTEKGKSHSCVVDEEMAETAQTYVDYVTSVAESDPDAQMWIEQHFTLASLNPPFEAGGTADAVIYLPRIRTLEVVDLKGGRGHVVEVIGNPQGRTYALGAMLAHQGLDVDHIRVTIVQPRAPHKDGRTRSETFHISELVEWTADLVKAMHRSHDALLAATAIMSTTPDKDPAWAAHFLKAGDHCKFCRAKAFCPAIESKAMATVGAWFDDLGTPRVPTVRPDDDPVERGRKLDLLDMMEGWISAYREDEHRRAEMGDPAANYVLVDAEGREKWNDGVEAAVLDAVKAAKLPEAKYLNPGKLRTPKQIRKELGPKADLVAGLSSTPKTGHNLVRADKTTRTPVLGNAAKFFEPQQ